MGQGNFNALIGPEHEILAYFDFGYSTASRRQPSPPLKPCFCDRPLVVLSHWDADHINLAKHEGGRPGLALDWLVPDQKHSSFAGKVQKWIKQAGGRLHVWPQSRERYQHMSFPWGFVEHCTEDPKSGINGSGLAVFVCVQNARAAPAQAQRNAAAQNVRTDLDTGPTARARQAYAAVPGRVTALINVVGNRPAITTLARPLAVALASSQTITGRQPHMPVGQCVDAAVRAAERRVVHNENAAQIHNQLHNVQHQLGTLRGHNVGWTSTVLQELAGAAVAASARNSYRGRFQAACANLRRDSSIDADAWPHLAMGARAGGAPAFQIRSGLAPVHADERFVLLNGDADFRWVPSMNRVKRPRLVGLTAMHHGAVFEDGQPLTAHLIPFAPGSKAALAVQRFNPAKRNASLIAAITEAGLALRRGRGRRRQYRVAASRTARAAAAAILAVEAAHPNEVTADPPKFAQVAAAAAVAAWRYPDAGVVGLAAMLATTTAKVSRETGCSAIESVVEVAAKAIDARRHGNAITDQALADASLGALDGDLFGHIDNLANDLVANGQQALTPHNVGGEAASALILLHNSYKRGLSAKKAREFKQRIALDQRDEDVLNDVATAATAAILASAHNQANRHTMRTATDDAGTVVGVGGGGLAGLGAATRTAVRSQYGAAAGGAPGLAIIAAQLAAERAVAYLVGCSVADLRAVVRSSRAKSPSRAEVVRVLGPRWLRSASDGRIAFSYGVDSQDNSHEYNSIVAGNMGHPHPLAVNEYAARGWVLRRNASKRAAHPGIQGDPHRQHSHGSAALAWDSLGQNHANVGTLAHRCPICGKQTNFEL